MRTSSKTELTDIKKEDQAWFSKTARNMALKTVGSSRPDLIDDAEAAARLTGWMAYREGCTRATTAWAMLNGATEVYRDTIGRSTRIDPVTRKTTHVYGHRDVINNAQSLMFVGDQGQTEERSDLPRSLGGLDALLGNINFEQVLGLLPSRHAFILRMRYKDGLEVSEIAHYTGSNSHRVQKIIQRALIKLRIIAGPLLIEHFDGMVPPNADLFYLAANPKWVRKKQVYVPAGPDKRYSKNRAEPGELYTHAGRSLSLAEWAEQPESVVDYLTLRRRVVRGKTDFVEALTKPIKVYVPGKNVAREKRDVAAKGSSGAGVSIEAELPL